MKIIKRSLFALVIVLALLMAMVPTVAADFDPKGSRSDPAEFPKYGEWARDAATEPDATEPDDTDTDHHATPGVMVPAEEDQRAYWSSFELVLSKEGTLKIFFFGCLVATEEEVNYILLFDEDDMVLVFSNQHHLEIRQPSPELYRISKFSVEPAGSTEGGDAS